MTISIARAGAAAVLLTLGGCIGFDTLPKRDASPALEVLALDYERTSILPGTQVSGTVAHQQRRKRIATATWGRLRREATGPIPTEVLIEVDRLTTSGGRAHVTGTLKLRDLAFGTILASQENFSATGRLPKVSGLGEQSVVFRAFEDEVLDWVSELECDTDARLCGPRIAPASETVTTEGADLNLAEMVENRPSGLRKINRGGIDAAQVVAAAEAPPEPAAAGGTRIGTTVAALGLLDRSGFWLQTPLVSSESAGEVVDPGTGKRIAVTLLPKAGPAGGGSQISLAALSALGRDMTALVTLEVYR